MVHSISVYTKQPGQKLNSWKEDQTMHQKESSSPNEIVMPIGLGRNYENTTLKHTSLQFNTKINCY